VFCSKSSLKEGKMGKRWGAKSLKKKKRLHHTISKKIGAKVQLNTKMGCKIRKGAKRWGAKSLKKKRGCKIVQLAKDRGKVQLSL